MASNLDKVTFLLQAGGVGACPTSVANCLVSRAFKIDYEDEWGDSWQLEVPLITWRQ